MISLLRVSGVLEALRSSGVTFAANTPNLNGIDQYFDAGTSVVYGDFDFFVTARIDLTSGIPTDFPEIMSWQDTGPTLPIWRLTVLPAGIEFKTQTSGGTTTNSVTVSTSAGVINIVAGVNDTSGNIFITVNNSAINTTTKTFTFSNAGGNSTRVGANNSPANDFFPSAISFCGVGRGVPTASDIDELNTTVATCYDNMSTGLKAKFEDNGAFWELANWENHTGGELTDRTGNGNDLTAIGSPTYTDNGLSVECTP